MQLALSTASVALAFWLFERAPEGLNAFSTGALALIAAALISLFRAGGGALRDEARPLARALGLRPEGGYGLFNDAHCYLRGEHDGRPVEIAVYSAANSRYDRKVIYTLRGDVPAHADMTIKILPVLGIEWDRYLEHLPPVLPGQGPAGYTVYGEPPDRAQRAVSRLSAEFLGRLPPGGGFSKDTVRLAAGRCRFESTCRDKLPTPQHVRGLLELCAALAHAAESV